MQAIDKGDPERRRFLMELEFVQCLANPMYLKRKKNRISIELTK